MKPTVVFFGEAIKGMEKAVEIFQAADLILIIGSSLVVNPAASLPRYRNKKSKLVIINKGSTYLDAEADGVIDEDIDTFLSGI